MFKNQLFTDIPFLNSVIITEVLFNRLQKREEVLNSYLFFIPSINNLTVLYLSCLYFLPNCADYFRSFSFEVLLFPWSHQQCKKGNFTDYFLSQIPESLSEEVELCNAQMNYKDGELMKIIRKVATVMSNQPFIEQMLEINDDICRLSLWQRPRGDHDKMATNVHHKMADDRDKIIRHLT